MNKLALAFAALLTIGTFSAQAQVDKLTSYSITEFNINPESFSLPKAENISSGQLLIDEQNHEVVLTILSRYFCPANMVCTMVMPQTTIRLPITYKGSGICGGSIIEAKLDQRPVDGNLQAIYIYDDNGNICSGASVKKPVAVRFEEALARDPSGQVIESSLTAVEISFEMTK